MTESRWLKLDDVAIRTVDSLREWKWYFYTYRPRKTYFWVHENKEQDRFVYLHSVGGWKYD